MIMSNKPFFYVANWKMNLHFHQTVSFCAEHYEQLLFLAEKEKTYLILCPTFLMIEHMQSMFRNTPIAIGAQNCSQYNEGAYTGEISAQSLMEVGCRYCIVGHSERRMFFGETNEIVANKVSRLLEQSVRPIMCIGETLQERQEGKMYDVLAQQLEFLCTVLMTHKPGESPKSIFFAYEPVWAIGTGVAPSQDELKETFAWIKEIVDRYNLPFRSYFLYGGSVSPHSISDIKTVENIHGVLLGSASTDFQILRKIVLSL